MGQELVIPDSFKKGVPAQAFASLNAHDDNLSVGIGQSYAVLGYKGKQWSLRYRGERHNFLRPDDGTPASYIDVVVLGTAQQKSKSLYKKYDPGTSDGERPICSSIDGVKPDADVAEKQCTTCVLCPKNEWKTDPVTGRKGRECTDYKRLAVLIIPTLTKQMLGSPLMEPVFLRVPPASLNSLAILGETMAAQGYHYSTYITRISFDPNESHPKMVFRPLQGLTDAEAPIIMDLRSDPNVGRIIGGDVVVTVEPEKPTLAAPGTNATGLSSTNVAPQTVSTTPSGLGGTTTNSQTQASVSTEKASAQPATTTGEAPLKTTTSAGSTAQKETVENPAQSAFGGATLAADAPLQPAQQTVGDTGLPEDSDADLDARIAGLIQTQ